ncbi:MAG: response regulator [Planctomycetota bacterium]|nr:MAG: response regulator [Planctomycetota bacterium]
MSPHIVLLVEDDESDVLFLKRAFKKAGLSHRLEVVMNGRAAVQYLSGGGSYADREKHPMPSHILLDLKLPEKSGFEVLEWIRSDPELKDLHVSILTSSSESADIRKAKLLRADCYLVKPMSFSALLEVVASLDEWIRTDRVPAASLWADDAPARSR